VATKPARGINFNFNCVRPVLSREDAQKQPPGLVDAALQPTRALPGKRAVIPS
jgi:hypothetical protein